MEHYNSSHDIAGRMRDVRLRAKKERMRLRAEEAKAKERGGG
jgi:hypothetical protein